MGMYCSVADQIFNIIRLMDEDKKKPIDFGNGVLLGYAEVQFLETVFRYPDENVSALSKRLGITKGAVTHMVVKLCQKELLKELRHEDNKKEKFFCLTDSGVSIVESHQLHHKQANQRLCQFIATLNDEQSDAVFRFLKYVKECIPFCEFPCGCETAKKMDKEEKNYESTATADKRPACRA